LNNVIPYITTTFWQAKAFLFFILITFQGNSQTFNWAVTAGGIYSDKATDLAIDAAGDVYVSGYYNVGQPVDATANFGSIVAPAGNWGKEGFLAKVSASGTWQWVNGAIGGYDERVLGICTDNVNGFVYATGTTWAWNSNDIFDFGSCGPNFGNPGSADEIFISKFDLNGNCIWTIGAGSDGDDHGFDLATDKAGNIYLTGFISDHYGFPNNPGYFGSFVVPLPGDSIAYVAKLSSNGIFQWVRTFDGLEGERDNRIAVDSVGNVYITGGFWGTKQFGSTFLTSAGGYDAYVVKYDNNGNFMYAVRGGSPLDDRGSSITIDPFGDIYITGEFRDYAIFGTDTMNNNGGPNGRDIFVAKMKPNGTWVWATKAGSNGGGDRGDRIVSNKKGDLFVTGQFKGNAAFGSISLTALAQDSLQVFIAAIDTAGKWKWAVAGGSSYEDRGTGLACDDSCNVYNCGYYETSATFGSHTVTGPGKKEVFVTKIIDACIAALNITSTNVVCNGQCNGTATATLSGVAGPFTYTWSTTPAQNTQTAINLCAGSYIVAVTNSLGNTYTQTVTITQPSVLAANVSGNLSCSGLCNGSATVTASGGNANYTYAWSTSPVQTSAIASGLCAGNYTCTITDGAGCPNIQTVTILSSDPINTLVNSTNIICNGQCDGLAGVTASGTSPFYTYSWSTNPVQTGTNVSNLCAGNYTCTITDTGGCAIAEVFTITQPAPFTAISSVTPISCSGASNASATLTISGGLPPYAVFWNSNPPQNINPASDLAVGTYTAIVSDSNDCIAMDVITISDLPPKDSLAVTGSYCLKDPTVQLAAPAVANAPYQWFLNTNAITWATNSVYTSATVNTGGYAVTWFYKGCGYVSSALLETIYQDISSLPQTNVFTPNADKLNDDFLPFSIQPPFAALTYQDLDASIEEYELNIYDRWGKLLFSTSHVLETWDGGAAPAGTYYWIAKYKDKCTSGDEHTLKGFVQLLR